MQQEILKNNKNNYKKLEIQWNEIVIDNEVKLIDIIKLNEYL